MTVTTTDVLSGPYFPNGSVTVFPFDFTVIDGTDLRVFNRVDGSADADYDPSLYSVTVNPSSGSVVFDTAPPAAGALYIALAPPLDNLISFGIEEDFYPQSHNEGFDRSALRDQFIADIAGRGIVSPIGEPGVVLPPAADRLGGYKVLGPNPVTGAIEILDASGFKGDPGGTTLSVGTYFELPGLFIPFGVDVIQTSGFHAAGDGGHALYYRVGANPNLGAGGVQSFGGQWWRYLQSGPIRIEQMGAKCDGVYNDTQALLDARTVSIANDNLPVVFPRGKTLFWSGLQVVLGTFTSPAGTSPFYRGLVQAYSGMKWDGNGCKLLMSGGRVNPGGLFYQDFWNAGSYVEDVEIFGFDLDGNLAAQSIEAYPAGTPDNEIWQHGDAIVLGFCRNVKIHGNKLQGWRGNGVSLFSPGLSFNDPLPTYIPATTNGVEIIENEFFNIFGCGVAGTGMNVSVKRNYFHGPGFWVGAITPEAGDDTGVDINWDIEDNIFDFRDGLTPPESTPQFASNSPEALAARVHLRRALCANFAYGGFPAGYYNDQLYGVRFVNNKIWQGIAQIFNHSFSKVNDNRINNFFEDVSQVEYSGGTAIAVSSNGNVFNLRGCEIKNNTIVSDLDGYGILVSDLDDIMVAENSIRLQRRSGIRLERSAGFCHTNRVRDVGVARSDAEIADDNGISSGIEIYGDNPNTNVGILSVHSNHLMETRGTGYMRYGVWMTVDLQPGVVVRDNDVFRASVAPIFDADGGPGAINAVQVNNRVAGDVAWSTNRQISATQGLVSSADSTFQFKLFAPLSWQNPFISANGDALWINAGHWWTKAGYLQVDTSTWPQSATDGVQM